MADDRDWVVLHRGPGQELELLADALGERGIEVLVRGGMSGAAFGAAEFLGSGSLVVPEDQLESAQAHLEALRAGTGQEATAAEAAAEAAAAEAEGADASDLSEDDDGERPRSVVLAVGLSLLLPGAGHPVAGQPWTGLLLVAAWVLNLFVLWDYSTGPLVVLLHVGVPIHAGLATRAANRGRRWSPVKQMLGTAVVVLGLRFALIWAVPTLLPDYYLDRIEDLAAWSLNHGMVAHAAEEACRQDHLDEKRRLNLCTEAAILYLSSETRYELKQEARGFAVARSACKDGSRQACVWLAYAYRHGIGVAQDAAAADAARARACELGQWDVCPGRRQGRALRE